MANMILQVLVTNEEEKTILKGEFTIQIVPIHKFLKEELV